MRACDRAGLVQEKDEDVIRDADGIDANDDATVQYNSSSHQAVVLNLAERYKQDSLPVLQSGQLCSNILVAMHLAQLCLAILITLHDKLSLPTTLHNLACKPILYRIVCVTRPCLKSAASLSGLHAGSQLDGQNIAQMTDMCSMVQITCPQPGHLVICIPTALASSELTLKYV